MSISVQIEKRYSGSKFNKFLQWLGIREKEVSKIHAVWVSKNEKYPDLSNIMYAVLNDNNWSEPIKIDSIKDI